MKTCISRQLVFWIDAKLCGHYPYLILNLSSHIALGTNKGNLMCCPITRTSHLRKEMQSTNKKLMSFSNLNIFNFKHFLWHNPSLSNSRRFLKWLSCYWHPRPIKESSSSPRFFQWSCQVQISRWFVILWWYFLCSWWPCAVSSFLS
jgi:hypothetical protein